MSDVFSLHEVGRLPLPGDNVAIAIRRLEAGTRIQHENHTFALDFTVLEGHRFAIEPVAAGSDLLSWNLPFGTATRSIEPGAYVCNEPMLEALRGRRLDFALPTEANFENNIRPFVLDEADFTPAAALPRHNEMRYFEGYRRSGGRGVGTRNMIVLLGTTSRAGGFVRQMEQRLATMAAEYPNVDGIVAVAHTEGGGGQLNNRDFLLRTLAGFMVHPNVGAVLAVDVPGAALTNAELQTYLQTQDYPLADVPHHFFTLDGAFLDSLARAETIVKDWLPQVNETPRTAEPLSELKLALQCGGSDAFSGVSGNPLASWVARELIRYGGAANLAETDELIGAEPYALQKVTSLETARKFLTTMESFKARAAWHGSSAEGNPSGGNKFRGLYNIALKSIGAAMKRHPDVPLDAVIDYSEPMRAPGFYFMDSPGNDLESIAGQVAAGCNMIYFVTGNGSITNFPFVPTIKIVTTSRRYALLPNEMDVNAGAYLDGTPMDDLGAQTLDLTVAVASGQLSVGEKAGHSQVQIWRDWQQTSAAGLDALLNRPLPTGQPLPLRPAETPPPVETSLSLIPTDRGMAARQVGLILPTSLCSGQVARMSADRFNRAGIGQAAGLDGFLSLVHTEGCGVSSGASETLYVRTLLGYLAHPLVRYAVLLEHGCEKTHNDYMRAYIEEEGLDPLRFGWASVQLDGGIDKAIAGMEAWFTQRLSLDAAVPPRKAAGLADLRIGLMSDGPLSVETAAALATLTRQVVAAGGTVVLPDHLSPLTNTAYREALLTQPPQPTLAYAQTVKAAGLHCMETETEHWVETLAGLGATGVDAVLAHVGSVPLQGHPLVPVVQFSGEPPLIERYGPDLDLALSGAAATWLSQLWGRLSEVLAGVYTPSLARQGNIDFQITRGLLGVSL